jgi:hypothetical protein
MAPDSTVTDLYGRKITPNPDLLALG